MKNVLIVIGSITDSVKTSSGNIDAVTGATRHMEKHASGESTMEIGKKMKEYLESRGCTVRITRAADCNNDLSPHDLIIIGSSIQGGVPLPDVKPFIDANRAVLSTKKVAVFAAYAAAESHRKRVRKWADSYTDKVACGLNPVSKAVFAGSNADLGWFLNLVAWRLVLGVKKGDYRDWEKIETWTAGLVED